MRFKVIFVILAAGLTLSHFALAKASKVKEWVEIQEDCHESWSELPKEEWNGKSETVGVTKYVLTSRLIATQPEFAYGKYLDSEDRHIKKHEVTWDPKKEKYTFSNQRNNRSLYPTTSAIEVISYQGELYIIDGHHRALLSTCYGSPMTPVQIRYDFSELSRVQFMEKLKELQDEEEFVIHYRGGHPVFIQLWQMVDDPYLWLARTVTRNVRYDEERKKVEKSDGADPFLILKVNYGIPAEEFLIAAIAKKLFPKYKRDDKLSKDDLKELAKALSTAKWAKDRWRFIVAEEPQSLEDKDIQKWIRRIQKKSSKASCKPELIEGKK